MLIDLPIAIAPNQRFVKSVNALSFIFRRSISVEMMCIKFNARLKNRIHKNDDVSNTVSYY